jgi:electron transfer flavoprotein alpha subunit
MNLAEYKGVYVFAQQVDNQISSIALELIGKGKDLAKDLGTTVTAVLVGSNVKGLADELGEYGADKVIVVDDPELKITELSRILMRSHLLSTSSSRTSS